MKYKNGLFAVFTVTLLSFGGWFAVLQTIDPFATDWFSRAMFYTFLILAISGGSCLIAYFISSRRNSSDLANTFKSSLRLGLCIGFALGGILILETINVLNILSATVFLLAIILIEFYLRSKGRKYS